MNPTRLFINRAAALFVVASALIASSARGQIIYSNDFSATGLGNASPEFNLDTGSGVFNYSVSGKGVTVSTASESIVDPNLNSGFVISTRFVLNNLAGSGGAITIGFGFLGTGNTFAGGAAAPYYQADWFALGTSGAITPGGLRIQSPGDGSDFSAVSGNSGGGGVVGTTYELKLTATYGASNELNLVLSMHDENGLQLGTVATATDSTPLTGEFFGFRNRMANTTHVIDTSHDYFSVRVPNSPLTISDFTDISTGINTTNGPLSFTVSGGVVSVSNLVVEATSSNTTLLPPSSFILSDGGSNRFLTIVPAANQTGSATVTVRVSDGVSFRSSVFDLIVLKEDSYGLTPLWNTEPNTQPYFTTTGGSAGNPNQRTMAYNSLSNHVYVVSRESIATPTFTIYVVDAETGTQLYTLNTNGMDFPGQVGLAGIDVADDGSIYICNVDISSPNQWRLYRWADGGSNTVPQLVFQGDPTGLGSSFRWGDVMDVRGGGTNTQIVLDNLAQNTETPLMAIVTPTDATLSTFASSFWAFLENPGAGAVARSLQFSDGNTILQRRPATPLILSSFDPQSPGSTAPIVQNYTGFQDSIGLVAVNPSLNLLGALNFSGVNGASPDRVELYDVTSFASPVLLGVRSFPADRIANNGNFGQIVFGGDKLFALEAQNGIVAYRVEIGSSIPPVMTINRAGGDVVLTWEGADFILESSISLSSPVWGNVTYQAGSPNVATIAIDGTKFFRLRK